MALSLKRGDVGVGSEKVRRRFRGVGWFSGGVVGRVGWSRNGR